MKKKEKNDEKASVLLDTDTHTIRQSIKKYIVFPLTLLCFLLGTVFIAEDNIRFFFGSYAAASAPVTAGEEGVTGTPSSATEPDATPQQLPFVMSIDDSEPLALAEYYYLNRDVLPDNIYGFNYNLVPRGELGIIPISLAREPEDGVVYIKNSSKYDIRFEDYLDRELPIPYEETEDYTVLIIHTHGTEAYTPDGVLSDDPKDPYLTRSEDNDMNVVSVGKVMAEVFEENNIHTLHHAVAIDLQSRSDAYENSGKVILDYLEKYPTIKYVFDVHRDGLTLSTGEKAKVICEIDGKRAAQVMCVVGTDTLGQKHPDWENNLAFAVQLQAMLDEDYPNFCRPINVKQGAFNQHRSPMGLLLEVGTDGNTLQEAQYSAVFLAQEISRLIKSVK